MIHSSSGRIDGAYLSQRRCNAERDDGNNNPSPDDGHGLAVGEGDVHGRGEAKRNCHDGKGQTQDAHHAETARQLALVTQLTQDIAVSVMRLHDGDATRMGDRLGRVL